MQMYSTFELIQELGDAGGVIWDSRQSIGIATAPHAIIDDVADVSSLIVSTHRKGAAANKRKATERGESPNHSSQKVLP